MIFSLISETRLVSASELYRLGQALERQCAQVCATWLIDDPVAITVVDRASKLPPGCYPIVFVDQGGDEGVLGEHWWRRDKIPAARVYVESASGLNAGSNSVSEVASHEVIEALVDPTVAVWWDFPGRPGVQVAAEIADPCQDTYGIRANGTDWQVSNWVTPAWSRADLLDPAALASFSQAMDYGVDWGGRLSNPGEISAAEGYAVFRRQDEHGRWVTWSEDAWGKLGASSAKLHARKRHPASRTARRGGIPA